MVPVNQRVHWEPDSVTEVISILDYRGENLWDMRPPSRSEWILRTRGLG